MPNNSLSLCIVDCGGLYMCDHLLLNLILVGSLTFSKFHHFSNLIKIFKYIYLPKKVYNSIQKVPSISLTSSNVKTWALRQ